MRFRNYNQRHMDGHLPPIVMWTPKTIRWRRSQGVREYRFDLLVMNGSWTTAQLEEKVLSWRFTEPRNHRITLTSRIAGRGQLSDRLYPSTAKAEFTVTSRFPNRR